MPQEPQEDKFKILVVMEQGIGNMVLTTPALRAVHEKMPDAELVVYGKRPALDVLEGAPFVSRAVDELPDEIFNLVLRTIWHQEFMAKFGVDRY